MNEAKEPTGVKHDPLLVRIIRLKNKVIELWKKILLLISKGATDTKIVKLIECLIKIDTDCNNEKILKQSEASVEELEKQYKNLIQNDVNFEKRKISNGKKHTGPRYNTTTLLGRIMKLKKDVIKLGKKILSLISKVAIDAKIVDLIECFVNIDTECDSEETLEQSEDRVEELEALVKKLGKR